MEGLHSSVIDRPWPPDTEVKVVNVVEPPSLLTGREMLGYDPEFEMVWKALRESAKESVAKAAEKLRAAKFSVSTELVDGDPKSQIIDTANHWRADMIVLESHGRTGLSRFLMGSFSQAVVRHVSSNVWETRSSGANSKRFKNPTRKSDILPTETIIPFGNPVVPEVQSVQRSHILRIGQSLLRPVRI
jgi:nucleotide-binding universal stress UspA family protein